MVDNNRDPCRCVEALLILQVLCSSHGHLPHYLRWKEKNPHRDPSRPVQGLLMAVQPSADGYLIQPSDNKKQCEVTKYGQLIIILFKLDEWITTCLEPTPPFWHSTLFASNREWPFEFILDCRDPFELLSVSSLITFARYIKFILIILICK